MSVTWMGSDHGCISSCVLIKTLLVSSNSNQLEQNGAYLWSSNRKIQEWLGLFMDPGSISTSWLCFPRLRNQLSFFLFLRQSLALLPKLACSGTVLARCSLHLAGSSDSPASASWIAAIKCACHHTWLIFVFLVERVSPYWPGCSQTPELMIHQSWPPKMLGWATVPSPNFYMVASASICNYCLKQLFLM